MHYKPNMGYILSETNYKVDRYRNYETLNIFCDGSYLGKFKLGGYAAVGVVCEQVIQVTRRGWTQDNKFANDLMELYAFREALSMAFMYRDIYPSINIFSDSSYVINAVKTWIYKWKFDSTNHVYVKGSKCPANINIVYELATNVINLMMLIPNFNIMYTKGHLDSMGNIEVLIEARNTFCRENCIPNEEIDLNFIRYMSRYNEVADKQARIGAHSHKKNHNMTDAIEFQLQNINLVAQTKIQSNIKFT